jgi:hypothetical protein
MHSAVYIHTSLSETNNEFVTRGRCNYHSNNKTSEKQTSAEKKLDFFRLGIFISRRNFCLFSFTKADIHSFVSLFLVDLLEIVLILVNLPAVARGNN